MRLPILSDLHLSNNLPYSKVTPDGETDRLKDIKKFFIRLYRKEYEHVLILGDLFDNRRLDAVTIKVGTKCVRLLSQAGQVYLVPGNHDTEDAAGMHNTLQFLEAIGPGVKVFKTGDTLEFGDTVLHAFPYLSAKKFIAAVEETADILEEGKKHVALIHQAVKGAKQGEHDFPSEIPPSILSPFDLVLSGHVHHRQRIKNVEFVGSSYNIDFREANQLQGYHIFDTETLELEFVQSKLPRFRVFTEELGKFGKNDYVIIFDPDEEPEGTARMLVSKTKEEIDERKRLDVDVDKFTWEKAISSYVELQETDLDADQLAALGLKFLGEPESRAGSIPGLVTFKTIEASNFMCFEHLEPVRLDAPGVTFIAGKNTDTNAADSNGAGKTSLVSALTWALYGEIITKHDVVRRGAKKRTEAILCFEKSGHEYTVHRHRTKTRTGLILLMDGKNISKEGSQKDTQQRICKLMGLDFLSFRNSVLYGQGDRMKFADPGMKDADRKKIFRSALGMDEVLKKAQQVASSYKSERKASLNSTEAKIEKVEEWIPKQKMAIERLIEKRDRADERKTQELKVLEEQLEDIPDDEELQEKLAKWKKRKADFDRELEKFDDGKQRIKELKQERQKVSKKNSDAERECDLCKDRLSAIETEESRFSKGRCPTCGTATADGNLPRLMDELKRRRRDEKSKLKDAEKTANKTNGGLGSIDEEIARLERQAVEASKIANNSVKAQGEVKMFEAKIRHLEKDREKIENDIENLKTMENPYVGELKEARNDLKGSEAEIKELNAKIKKQQRAVDLLEFWIKGFGNQGLPAYVLELFLPRLEKNANDYLEILSDGDIEIRIDATKETGKGGTQEALNISFNIEGVEDAAPSGGQQKKIEIAIDLGFMDLLSEREGAEVGFVWLDEILDGLDGKGRSRVMVLIDELRRRKASTCVVSHDAELSASFDRTLLVVKKQRRSTVTEL